MMRSSLMLGSLPFLLVLGCDTNQLLEPAVLEPSAAASGPAVGVPTNTRVDAASASRIDVSWTDNSTKENGFEVHRSPNGADNTFVRQSSTGPDIRTSIDGAVDPSTPYCYKVRAFRVISRRITYSDFSNIACAPTGNLEVTSATTGVDLDPTGYSATLTAVTERGLLQVASSSLAINGTLTIAGLRAGNYYRITLSGVAANCDVNGPNPQSPTVISASTTTARYEVTCTLITPPTAPSWLATYNYILGIGLTWNDYAVNEDGFKIERCQLTELGCADADFVQIAQVPTQDSRGLQSFVGYNDFDGLQAWTTYVYRVRAFNSAGDSAPSEEATGMALGDPCEDFGC
jgi:hypothetical protein